MRAYTLLNLGADYRIDEHWQVYGRIENLLGRCKFNPDIYAGPFSAREIEVRNDTCTYNGTAYTAQSVIYGLDVVTGELANGDV